MFNLKYVWLKKIFKIRLSGIVFFFSDLLFLRIVFELNIYFLLTPGSHHVIIDIINIYYTYNNMLQNSFFR